MLLTACQPCENAKVNDAVKRLVELYVNLPAPNDTSEHYIAFMSWLKELVDKGLLAVNTTQTTGRVDRAQIHNAERILLTLAKKKPEVVDAYAPTLVKIVQKFTREHHAHMVQARQGNRQVMSPEPSLDPMPFDHHALMEFCSPAQSQTLNPEP